MYVSMLSNFVCINPLMSEISALTSVSNDLSISCENVLRRSCGVDDSPKVEGQRVDLRANNMLE